MFTQLCNGLYKIASIVRQGENISLYTACRSSGEKYVVNELVSAELIKENLKNVRHLENEQKLICSLENSCLYILTPYTEGEPVSVYFNRQQLPFCEHIRLAKEYLLYLISIQDMPDFMRQSALDNTNIFISSNEIYVNLFSRDNQDTVSENDILTDVFKNFFTSEQIKKEEGLKIILKKLGEGVYSDYTKFYLELNALESQYTEGSGFVDAAKKKKDAVVKFYKRFVTAAAIILALYVLYNMVDRLRNENNEQYVEVTRIGNVNIVNNEVNIE